MYLSLILCLRQLNFIINLYLQRFHFFLHAGCPRVAGDEEDNFDDDFDDEFQIKNHYDNPDQHHVTARSVI